MEEKLYKQKDLIDKATIKNYDAVEGYGRKKMLEACLPDNAEIQTCSVGSYSGKMSFVIKLDGEIWLHNDYFGSCSYCDSFIDNEKSWTEKILRKAYCFENAEDAIKYLETTEDDSWNGYTGNLIPQTKEMVEEVEENE